MSMIGYDSRNSLIPGIFYLFLAILLAVPMTVAAEGDGCSKGSLKSIRGSLELSQGRGGIWGYMEKSSALKKDSMVGFQVDAKLQRLVVGYENLCDQGKVPTNEILGFVMHQLDRARDITNKNPGRTSPKALMEDISTLNKDLGTILEKWNF